MGSSPISTEEIMFTKKMRKNQLGKKRRHRRGLERLEGHIDHVLSGGLMAKLSGAISFTEPMCREPVRGVSLRRITTAVRRADIDVVVSLFVHVLLRAREERGKVRVRVWRSPKFYLKLFSNNRKHIYDEI